MDTSYQKQQTYGHSTSSDVELKPSNRRKMNHQDLDDTSKYFNNILYLDLCSSTGTLKLIDNAIASNTH